MHTAYSSIGREGGRNRDKVIAKDSITVKERVDD